MKLGPKESAKAGDLREKGKKKQNLVNDVKNTLELGFKKNRPNYKMHSITILYLKRLFH